MNPTVLARVVAGTLTGIWLLAITFAWLLLPQVLHLSGVLLVVWYAVMWIPTVLIATIPFFVASTIKAR